MWRWQRRSMLNFGIEAPIRSTSLAGNLKEGPVINLPSPIFFARAKKIGDGKLITGPSFKFPANEVDRIGASIPKFNILRLCHRHIIFGSQGIPDGISAGRKLL